jgi:hypothetical protein
MKPQIKEYNCATGIEIIRDATNAEMAQMKLDAINYAEEKITTEAKAAAKLKLLDKLGITEDEAKLLLS